MLVFSIVDLSCAPTPTFSLNSGEIAFITLTATTHPMHHQRLVILLLLIAYLFSPSLFTWIISPNGVWYRPYIFWIGVVIVTFAFQMSRKKPHKLD
ncbi:MAG TPA: hypothetical protein VN030_06545 [Cellvibrio sp.]|nr:hypothetical protein [Cellvibrio sp.]